MISDADGNLYGTAQSRGSHNSGTLSELTPRPDGSWEETTLHAFCFYVDCGACGDGEYPVNSPVLDSAGNLYGTTLSGGDYYEVVYQLTKDKGRHWVANTLHQFSCAGTDGYYPVGGVIFDNLGNLYGTTEVGSVCGGNEGYGTLFRLNLKNGTKTHGTVFAIVD